MRFLNVELSKIIIMKKNKYEKPLVSVVDYELENNIADGESDDGAVVSVTAKGMSIEVESEVITYP